MKLITNFLIILFISFGLTSFAQEGKNPKRIKQIEAIKMGFISARLNLTQEEADNFWPLYKKYQSDWNQLNIQKREKRLQNSNSPDKMIDDDFYFDTKLLELKKKYRQEFAKVLPSEKIKKLYIAERDFREELIKQLKHRNERD